MKFIIVVVIAFLVILYLFTFLKRNKSKSAKEINSVEDFHMNYRQRAEERLKRRESGTGTTHYVTKYNSSEDYREK